MQTRTTLHRVATHVLARRRYEVTGRFGLRVTPGGIGTPAFGEAVESVRIAGASLVRETIDGSSYLPIDGASLHALATFAGADIDDSFSAGADTPPLGDVDLPLTLDRAEAETAMGWFAYGWRVLDAVLAGLPADAAPASLQLWPEHFDIGTNVGVGGDRRTNLGASLGDAEGDEPYLYVGPWDDDRPGDPAYWNAPFGAVLRRPTVDQAEDSFAAGVAFLQAGVDALRRET